MIKGSECENEGLRWVANLMLVSARTAPKTGGVDDIHTAYLEGEGKEVLAAEMEKIGEEKKISGYVRDAKNVRDSEFVVLIGVCGTKSYGGDCGACGFAACDEFDKVEKQGRDFAGPVCQFKILDLGIALGSAVKTSSTHNVDNRIMYRAGLAAQRLKMLPGASVVYGIPISAKGKNIYFDRKPV